MPPPTLSMGDATWCPVSSTSMTRAAKWKGKSAAKQVSSQEDACRVAQEEGNQVGTVDRHQEAGAHVLLIPANQ